MNEIEALERLKSLVREKPILAGIMEPMIDLLARASVLHQDFQNAEDQTLGHLERDLKEALGGFMARLLQEAAQAKADKTPPECPVCRRRLTRRRKLEQVVLTAAGEIKVARVRGWCSKCKEWLCPGDEALGVQSGYSPHVQEMAALLASKMPLGEAAAVLERTTGIKLPATTLDRVAKRAAEKALKKRGQMDEQARLGGDELKRRQVCQKPPGTLVIMMDAWNIRERDDFGRTEALRKQGEEPKRWHWVWTGTVFEMGDRSEMNGRPVIVRRGFVATREGLEGFARQLHAEALRHGLGRAAKVIVMGDGAAWIWNLAEDRFKEAVQRVDLYHIKQHLWTIAKELHPDQKEAAKWVRGVKNQLKKGKARRVVATLEETLQTLGLEKQETVRKEVGYLKSHEGRMTYAGAEARNEPCGTGAIESTCRQYQCRFKRPGQFWSREGDEALLCLDNFWRNNRWTLLFPHSNNLDPSRN